ncbi:SDR family NAD(P)-dependent oxidoreductase [Naasia lichenicola]|uniref:SDR family NAD(P)-dependent oxidoreductase n=1 Tax=Naasia lichenicola TaxID=2565933 RepID=UPI00130E1D4F|nr:SDR family NAD(P)-dependent oxidoreductase [Naasia lichenicola]
MHSTERGRVVLTGATRGVGLATALQLAALGHPLVLPVRDPDRGAATRALIQEANPSAVVDVLPLDLAALSSVREFAALFADRIGSWDALVNNAGAILVPERTLTIDGFEMHLGVNHLAPYALTGLLLPFAAPGARVVTVSSLAARWGRIQFHDLRWDHGYSPFRAYAASKRAGLLFARRLHAKAQDEGLAITSVATHPGYSVSEERLKSPRTFYERVIGQGYAAGAAANVRAVTDPSLRGGEFLGPGNLLQTAGGAKIVGPPPLRDELEVSGRLWRLSGQLTRIPW